MKMPELEREGCVSADGQSLRGAMRSLMTTLVSGIVSLNEAIDELAETRAMIDHDVMAQVLDGLANRHRARVVEMQSQLAALTEDYAVRFPGNL